MRKAFITSNPTSPYTPVTELTEGKNIPVGRYAIYVDGAAGVALELFKDNVSFIAKRTEGYPPLAVGGDDAGKLRLKDFPAGAYRLVMNTEVINFTVGTTTPPSPNEPILEEYIENGTHYVVRTASGMYKAPVTKV